MNPTFFVALVVVLAFAIGFFVAAIIWFISWAISPKDELNTILRYLKSSHSISKTKLKDIPIISIRKQSENTLVVEGSKNI